MSALDELLATDAENAGRWRDNFRMFDPSLPEIFDTAAEMFITFSRCIEGTQDESAEHRVLEQYGKAHGLTAEEVIRRLAFPEAGSLVSPEARQAFVQMRPRRARAVVFLLLQRSYMWGATDLLRMRLTPAVGYCRLKAEAIGLMLLMQDDPNIGDRWLKVTNEVEGREFFGETQGVARRESTETEKETEVRRILKDREGRVDSGQPMLPRADRIAYEEAAADLREHYRLTGSRNLEEASDRLQQLDAFFTGSRIARIGPADITQYVLHRQKAHAANGTINRELAILGRMLRLAYENGKLLRLPIFRQLEEAPPRAGFFEREQYEAVRRHLPADLQVAVTIAYTYGWRMKSEVLVLELRQVDLEAGTIRLDPGATKNDEGRVVYLTPELQGILREQVGRVMALMGERGAAIPYLFPHLSGRFAGQRIQDFRKTWTTACREAMLERLTARSGRRS